MARKPRGKLAENLAEHAGPDHDRETIEKLAAAAKAANAKPGHNSGEPTDEVIQRNRAAIELGYRNILAAQKLVQKAREEFGTVRKTAETDYGSKGWVDSTVKAMKLKIQGERGGAGEMVTEHRQIGRILRLDPGCPLGTQFALFAMPEPDAPAEQGNGTAPAGFDAELQGQHAYGQGAKLVDNPFHGAEDTERHNQWHQGWIQAQNAKARTMGPTDGEASH